MAQHSGQKEHAPGARPIRQRTLDVVNSLHGRVGPIVRVVLAFELLRFLVLAAMSAGLLRVFLNRSGRCSIGNFSEETQP